MPNASIREGEFVRMFNRLADFIFDALILLLVISGTSPAFAQEPPSVSDELSDRRVLRIGTKVTPPFAIKNADGTWSGISIELWNNLANELNLEYEFEELTLDEMLDQLETGELDAAVAAISVTSDRYERIGFCHPHYSTGLSIAVAASERNTPWLLAQRIVSSRLVRLVLTMVVIVAICGFLFWLFERKQNTTMFGGKRRQGIGMGLWWSMTLLLGHKGVVPSSRMGRILAVIAMIASIILLSILTGVITSILTVQQLDIGISRVTDLHDVRVATVASSSSADYLKQRRIFFREYATPREALEAVENGEEDAVVYDDALLRYLAGEDFANRIDVLPVLFNVQEYAIGLQQDSDLREALNEKLLSYRESDAWEELLFRYIKK